MVPDNKSIAALNLNSLPVGVCIIRENYTISTWNQTLEKWTGIDADDATDNLLSSVVKRFADPLIKDRMNVVFNGGGPVILSSRFHSRIFPLKSETQNEGKFQKITISPFELPDGEPRAMIAVEDVTAITEQVFKYRQIKDQIKYELEEKKKTEKALAVAINKLNTLASITRHDLNNSLTVFLGYLYIILNNNPEGKIAKYLENMKQAAEVMRNHIAFARDYQEMGHSLPSWFNIHTLVETSGVGPTFSGVTFTVETGTLEVLADPLIKKAIYNLLENAVRHGEHTSLITFKSLPVEDKILLIIEDNGKGVPESIKEKIFERGFGSNTGLGLFLVREILGITGMEIKETGTEGTGAKFEIRVPAGNFRYPGR